VICQATTGTTVGVPSCTAINKYVYVTVNDKFDDSIRVSYSKTEEVSSVTDIQHKIVRGDHVLLRYQGGVEITSIADIPSRGTGLGSSSAFTVGLLNALHAHRSNFVAADTLAQEACYIEIDTCGEPIGKQDQYASAFGGLNSFNLTERHGLHQSHHLPERDDPEASREYHRVLHWDHA
jgi:D-glycero-alpha-D-manno-heptose-7-phosphate kinase